MTASQKSPQKLSFTLLMCFLRHSWLLVHHHCPHCCWSSSLLSAYCEQGMKHYIFSGIHSRVIAAVWGGSTYFRVPSHGWMLVAFAALVYNKEETDKDWGTYVGGSLQSLSWWLPELFDEPPRSETQKKSYSLSKYTHTHTHTHRRIKQKCTKYSSVQAWNGILTVSAWKRVRILRKIEKSQFISWTSLLRHSITIKCVRRI